MISAELTLRQASFCALRGSRRLERRIHPGASKGHFKGMCSTRSVVVLPSPLPVHHRMLVIFLRSFSCFQPLLRTSTVLSNPQHQLAEPSNNFLSRGG